MDLIFYIFLGIVVIMGGLGIIYITFYNQMQNYLIRINEAESIIDIALRERYDLIEKSEKVLKKEVKLDLHEFRALKAIKKENISSFDFDRSTTKCINLIIQVKKDYPSLDNNSDFKIIFQDIKYSEEKIESGKSFYNRYTTKLNKIIARFPSNIIASIHHIKTRNYFDGKNLHDDNENDFKL